MATPTPRSRSQILGTMINSFLSRLGLPSIKVGDPSLSILEAAAQSDFRSTQDVFQNLSSTFLDGKTGAQLEAAGRDERVARVTLSPSNGQVTVGDSAFDKIETRLYQGGVGVAAGATSISVESSIPANGQLYIGRGTSAVEGPISYTTVTPSGSYFIVALSSPTTNYHQTGESVVYAQGGDRVIPVDTIVSTPTTSAIGTVQFRILNEVVIPDGETSVSGVQVECTQQGSVGNVGAGAITSYQSLPFSTATVTNPLPFGNGNDQQTDDSYREAIRLARKSRSKAIKDAIVNSLVGVRSPDESGTILSVSTVFRQGEPRTLYIDDGTGYQEKDEGVALETLTDSALGGEKYFGLTNRPVAKAYLKTATSAPFSAVEDSALTIRVGGVESTHYFGSEYFRDITAANAYEVADSVNANENLLFSARVTDSGTKVAFMAKSETNEDLELVDSSANDWLQLPEGRVFTLYLYKNGEFLYEDGQVASVLSKSQGDWGTVSTGATFTVAVDGVTQSITVTDADFVAYTEETTVSSINSIDSWCTVLNKKIAGLTATPENGAIRLTSNKGRSSDASIQITSGTLAAAFFESVPATYTGRTSDYSFDRNSGHIKLSEVLVAGDNLIAGTSDSNAVLVSEIGTLTTTAISDFWFVIDGAPTFPVTNIGIGTSLTWAVASSPAWGDRISITGPANTWSNAREGDWLIVTDSAASASAKGLFKVARVVSGTVIHIERGAGSTTGTVVLAEGGVYLVRSVPAPQQVQVPVAANYTPASLATLFNAIEGLTASSRGSDLRLASSSCDGDICIVAANNAARDFGFDFQTVKTGQLSHTACLVSDNSELDQSLDLGNVTAVASTTQFTSNIATTNSAQYKFLKPVPDSASNNRAHLQNYKTKIATNTTAFQNVVRTAAPKEFLVGDRFILGRGYSITARDTLQALLDDDSVSGRYNVNMYRQAKIVATGGGLELEETNGDSHALAFGRFFDWTDFMISMKARTKTHSSPDTTKTILYRWWRHGPEGDGARIQYQYPKTPNANVTVDTADVLTTGVDPSVKDVVIRLGAGAARTASTFRTSAKLGMAVTSFAANLYTYQFVSNLNVTAANRILKINYINRNSTAYAGVVTGSISGATANVVSDSNAGGSPAASGNITVTGVVGIFLPNEVLTAGGSSSTSTSSVYGYTTLTVALPGAVTNHGLPVGETVYFTPGDANFLSGARRVDAVTATTLSYIDTVATAAAAGAIGTVSNDVSGEVTLSGSTVVTGDIFSAVNATAFGSDFRKALKITVGAGSRDWTAQHFLSENPTSTTLVWKNLSGVTFAPLDATKNTAAAIAGVVDGVAGSPVSAVAVGSGGVTTGVVTDATYETAELGGTTPWWTLTDGFNWITSNNTPATTADNYIMQVRNAIATPLLSNAGFTTEDVRLVPRTALNIANYLNSTAVAGISSRGEVKNTRTGKVQIESDTVGSASGVTISGGTANSAGASVIGAAQVVDSISGGIIASGNVVQIEMTESDGIGGDELIMAVNSVVNDKSVFDSNTTLTSITTAGVVALNSGGTRAWTRRNSLTDNVPFMVEKVGLFTILTDLSGNLGGNSLNITAVRPGDWLYLTTATTPVSGTSAITANNSGYFRVFKVGAGYVIVDNPVAEEGYITAKVDFLSYNSMIPGDTVTIDSDVWGSGNRGARVVTALGATEWIFTLDVTTAAMTTSGAVAALGANSPLFRVIAEEPYKAVFESIHLAPSTAGMVMTVSNQGLANANLINEAFGTNIIAMSKLGFGSQAEGRDAYKKNTGLIEESNKIVFGFEDGSERYRGVASAGASYNISGPIVKRVKVGVAIRPVTGVSLESISASVKSAVASAVNKTPINSSGVSISKIIEAVQGVNGIDGLSISSPDYRVGSEYIAVQPYQKALVVDLENDITVTILGG